LAPILAQGDYETTRATITAQVKSSSHYLEKEFG